MNEETPLPEEFQRTAVIRIGHDRIIHQSHESETLIIDLLSGCYYCLEGPAPLIWEAAIEGNSFEQITDKMAHIHRSNSLIDLRLMVANFLHKLKQENLITIEGAGSADLVFVEASSELNRAIGAPEPKITKFDELADLLLADPIHEI